MWKIENLIGKAMNRPPTAATGLKLKIWPEIAGNIAEYTGVDLVCARAVAGACLYFILILRFRESSAAARAAGGSLRLAASLEAKP